VIFCKLYLLDHTCLGLKECCKLQENVQASPNILLNRDGKKFHLKSPEQYIFETTKPEFVPTTDQLFARYVTEDKMKNTFAKRIAML